MRRTANLLEQIVEHENLRQAVGRALRGKRAQHDARDFLADLDPPLERMTLEIAADTIRVGRSHQFVIHDPKERLITAPCFEERVLHHAIMDVCEPLFERWLVADTYACRKGKGRIACLRRTREFAGRFPFFLKLDIRRYFDSIPHDGLLSRLARLFKDQRLLRLWARIVRSHQVRPGRGLPIGSLTSQHFANFYLGAFDRFVKETLRVRGYVRYMDDMALWGESAAELGERLAACRAFLRDELLLELKPEPFINRTRHGLDFLGCRVFPSHLALNRRSRTRFRRKLCELERRFLRAEIDAGELQQRAASLVAFTRTEGVCSWNFRTAVLQETPVSGHRPRTA